MDHIKKKKWSNSNSLYNRIKNGESLMMFEKGDQIRDYVFIEDMVHFFEKVV